VSLEYTLGLEDHAPEFAALRDVYLEPWTESESREDLRQTFDLAGRLSPICSALGWSLGVSDLDESLRDDYVGAVPNLLREYLEIEDDGVWW
jgi:hypothetical protein